MTIKTIRVWDLPTRLTHWLLFLLVTAAMVTGLSGGNLMEWHGRIGLGILGLLTFRLIWGVIGSTYARFHQFVRGPAAIRAYCAATGAALVTIRSAHYRCWRCSVRCCCKLPAA
ncbi:cytochrome b/b6 domain-containing protein [Chromatium okenii]|uniref:cytochrome b/b6 domain-containing protein n=1 Tax=Chromatium okenii TaxID=61644 RepID=UPI003221A79C